MSSRKLKTRKPDERDAQRVAEAIKGARPLKVGEGLIGTTDKDGKTRWERITVKWRVVSRGNRKPPDRKAS